jgi:hypothetical protein
MCQISIGWTGSGGAIVRRQSIASISTEKLRRCEHHRSIHNRRPDEAPLLKSLGNQPHSATIPTETFEIVAAFATEDEEVPTERIGTDHLLGLRGKAVKSVAQIDGRQARKIFVPGARLITPAS